jgi:nucleoside-diphosphate-sugar epimerase
MIILQSKSQRDCFAVIVGLGLIGSCVLQKLQSTYRVVEEISCSNYSKPAAHKLGIYAQSRLKQCEKTVERVDYIYAAGSAGFFASIEQMRMEHDYALSLTERFKNGLNSGRFVGHLISSAGGLYEGHGHVIKDSTVAPERPYGEWKLALEKSFGSIFEDLMIYRPTSVYGHLGSKYRRGLITQLIWDSQHQATTSVFGSLHTLRDYLWAGDIGEYIYTKIEANISQRQTMILASGRPMSIFEILHKLERYLLRRPKIELRHANNARNITFNPSAIAPDFHSSPLDSCLPKIVHGV